MIPVPKAIPSGKAYLIHQDPADEKRGSIYIPKDSQSRYRATVGTIVAIGDGYEPEDPDWPEWESRQPYDIGTRVLWGRYQGDCEVKLKVEEGEEGDWWESEQQKRIDEGKVAFILVHCRDILVVLDK